MPNDPLPRFAHYYNEYAQLIGHDAADVNAWLAAHPGYVGSIWYNHADGGDDVDVSDIFAAPDRIERDSDRHAA